MGQSTWFKTELRANTKCSQHLMNIEKLNPTKNYGRYWIRTSDPFRVKEVRYHCANRPHNSILNHCL